MITKSVVKKIWKNATFGSLLKALRTCDELSQVDVAKQLGISKQFLNNVENEKKFVGVPFVCKVAKIMGYPLEPMVELLLRDQLKKEGLELEIKVKKLKNSA